MAEFEELKLSVTLTDDASKGLSNLRLELNQLIATAGQASTALGNVSNVVDKGARGHRTAADDVKKHEQALKALGRETEATARGFMQLALGSKGGLGSLPQMALGLREATQGLSGMGDALGALAPAARTAALAVGGVGLAVVAVGAVVVAYGISVFKFSREMETLSRTAKQLGTTFAELKTSGDQAKQFGASVDVIVQNTAGMASALADLTLAGSKLRAQLVGEGLDPKWLDTFTRTEESWKRSNMAREKAIAIEERLVRLGSTRTAAHENAYKQFLAPLGLDRGVVDRPAIKPPTAEEQAALDKVKIQSNEIDRIWGEIGAKLDKINFTSMAAGMPLVIGTLRVINDGIDLMVEGFKWLGEHSGDWVLLMGRVLENTPGVGLFIKGLEYLYKRGSEPVYGPQLPANDNRAGPAKVPEAATPNVRSGRNSGARAPARPEDLPQLIPGGEVAQPMSYQGTNDNNPLLHRTGYGGGSSGGEGRAKDLIKGGVYEALVDFYSYVQTSGRGGSGIVPAAYNPDGGAGAGAGTGAGGAGTGPFKSGAGFSVIRQGSYGGGTPNGSSVGPGTGPGAHGNANPPAQTGSEAVTTAQGGSDLDRGAYDKMFKGTPLEGKYDKVVETAKANNVPPSLMAAIMAHETGKGTSKMLREKNNPAGLMKGNTGRSYGTVDEGIEAAGRTIARNYQSGGGTIEGMQKSYAPIGAANDPGGLNSGWVGGVRRFQSQLGAKDGGGGAQTASIDPNQVLGTGNVDGTGAITGASTTGGKNPNGTDLPGRVQAVGGADPAAFITHHTSGRGTIAGVEATLQERGLGVQYVMDREGNIKQTGGPGASHIKTGWGEKGAGLSNRNVVGMEIIAKNDKDVTEAQKKAYAAFMAQRYPNTPIFGHGEVNPGHKEADEGMSAKNAALSLRERIRAGGGSQQAAAPGTASIDPNQVLGTGTVQNPKDIPFREQGTLTMEGQTYHYASGGYGRGATPPGTYPVNVATPYGGQGKLGDIGKRIGSVATVGGLEGTYKDPRYASQRAGIQIHQGNVNADHLDQLQTEGCFGIAADEWPAYKAHLIDMNKRTPGGLQIVVGKDGRAQITARGAKVSLPDKSNVPAASTNDNAKATPGREEPFPNTSQPDRAALDRAAVDRQNGNGSIHSTGSLNVDVKAPPGTTVGYKGQNLLRESRMQRQTQMPQTQRGPVAMPDYARGDAA